MGWRKRVWAAHASQESGRVSEAKTNHEKGFGCFMVPKSGVGMVWEGQTCSMKKEFGTSWFSRVEWEGLGKAQNEAFVVPKSGVGRAWEGSK